MARLATLRFWVFAFLVVFAAGSIETALALGLGSQVKPFSLADQHGASHTVDEGVRVIILTRDMAAGEMMKSALGTNGKSLLANHHAVYVSDISGMPSFVRNLVALPKLKERPYPMLLDTSGDLSARLPSKDKHATLIFLDKLHITAVEYLSNPNSLAPALEAPKRFAAH
jgi:hypothetical protein